MSSGEGTRSSAPPLVNRYKFPLVSAMDSMDAPLSLILESLLHRRYWLHNLAVKKILESLLHRRYWLHNLAVKKMENMPKCLHVSKQMLLKQAMQVLALEMHEVRTCAVGNNQLVGSVCIDVPAHNDSLAVFQKKFFGEYSLINEEALESASLAALTYLQEAGIILVDDANQSRLKLCEAELLACQRKVLASSSYANTFLERTEFLQAKLNATNELEKKPSIIAKKSDMKKETPFTPSSDNLSNSSKLKCKKTAVNCKPKCQKILFKKSCSTASSATAEANEES